MTPTPVTPAQLLHALRHRQSPVRGDAAAQAPASFESPANTERLAGFDSGNSFDASPAVGLHVCGDERVAPAAICRALL
jgi:hypothetical protein